MGRGVSSGEGTIWGWEPAVGLAAGTGVGEGFRLAPKAVLVVDMRPEA